MTKTSTMITCCFRPSKHKKHGSTPDLHEITPTLHEEEAIQLHHGEEEKNREEFEGKKREEFEGKSEERKILVKNEVMDEVEVTPSTSAAGSIASTVASAAASAATSTASAVASVAAGTASTAASISGRASRSGSVTMAEGGQYTVYTCDICGQDGLTEDDMKTHMLLEHVEGEISCPFCDLEGTSVDEMTWHINAEHLDAMTPTKVNPKSFPHAELRTTQVTIEDAPPIPPVRSVSVPVGMDSKDSSDSSLASRLSDLGKLDEKMDTSESESSDFNKYDSENSMPRSESEQWKRRARLHLDVNAASPRKKETDTVKSGFIERLKPSQIEVIRIEDTPMGEQPEVLITTTDPNGNSNIYVEPSPSSNDLFSCPLCEWTTSNASEITRHVNVKHLDALSPADISARNSNQNSPSSPCCPFCGISMDLGELEVHVNTKHLELLSPDPRRGRIEDEDLEMRTCPICGMEDLQDELSLAQHVDGHFSAEHTPVMDELSDNLLAQELERREFQAQQYREQKEFEKLQATYGMDNKTDFLKQSEKNMERAVNSGQMSISDYYARKVDLQQSSALGIDDGSSCTKDILSKLEEYYTNNTSSSIARYRLCAYLDHYASTYGDKGWGCGYRNLQMMLSSLARDPTYKQVLFNGRAAIPSIPKIQRLIESAWEKGFDVQGRDQLGGRVYNTNKWIGATEIYALLSSLKIKCQLIDFHAPSGIDGTHPRMFEWVRQYFTSEDRTEFRAPLYLQHQGHSRTIIGIEEHADASLKLLIFDPIYTKKQMQQFRSGINANMMRTIRRTIHGMKARQYQIVSVVGVLTEREFDDSRSIKSERLS